MNSGIEDYVLTAEVVNITDVSIEITNLISKLGLEKIKEQYIMQIEFL